MKSPSQRGNGGGDFIIQTGQELKRAGATAQGQAGEELGVACGCLPGVFQCDDGEDGPAVHAAHAGAITHVVVVDGGTVRANLGEDTA